MNGRIPSRSHLPSRPLRTVAVLVPLLLGSACSGSVTATATTSTARPAPGGETGQTPFVCPGTARTAGTIPVGTPLGQKLQVATTVAPITSIIANIAGDRAQVTGIIPEGEDSHTYEPKPSAARVLSEADVVFVNGLKLEDPTKELAENDGKPDRQIVELGTLTLTPDQYLYDFSFPREEGKPNPHLWTNPPMARCYAEIAASTLGRADPANAGYYRDNATKFTAKLDRLDELMKTATAGLAERDRALLTYHDAYAYFADHYGWRVIGAVQVSNFKDPTPKEVAALIEQVKAEKVRAVFGSEVFPSPVLAQIAAEAGVTYVDELRDDDLPGAPGEPSHSYLGLMKFDFVTMISNLGGDASGLKNFDDTDTAVDGAVYPQ